MKSFSLFSQRGENLIILFFVVFLRHESQTKIKELQNEIDRLSRLYDYEIGKQSKFEEKLMSLKQLAEEKQIESAALKFEYRKMKEVKETLQAENAYLKSVISSTSNSGLPSSMSPQKYAALIQQQQQQQQHSSSSPSSASSPSSVDMRRNFSGLVYNTQNLTGQQLKIVCIIETLKFNAVLKQLSFSLKRINSWNDKSRFLWLYFINSITCVLSCHLI